MTRIIPPLETVAEKRAALTALTKYYAVAAAITDRLTALLATIDDPAADRAEWENLIAQAEEQRRVLIERIDVLNLQLGIANPPDLVH